MLWNYVWLTLVGALIGWGTNWLAVKMLFRPRKPVKIAGISLQGLLPRRRADFARSVAATVEKELVSVEEIQRIVTKLAQGENVRAMLHERVDKLINEQLAGLGAMVRAFVPDTTVNKIKARIEQETLSFIASMAEQLHDGIARELDVHALVQARIEAFDLAKLEEIVFRIAARELRAIEVLGGVLGAFIGIVEAGILHMMQI
ncbi:MAG: DUF445 domain-containing protein [Planctomycetota bacterium]